MPKRDQKLLSQNSSALGGAITSLSRIFLSPIGQKICCSALISSCAPPLEG
jgi:hypothetical protein